MNGYLGSINSSELFFSGFWEESEKKKKKNFRFFRIYRMTVSNLRNSRGIHDFSRIVIEIIYEILRFLIIYKFETGINL